MRAWMAGILGSMMLATHAVAADDVLEEVVVTATLRKQALVEVPLSITVLDQQSLRDAGQQHFEDVLASVPNLHWAGGTSRPRYFQLRGIGEREQYEGAPNPSVGFLIDDIDFSGIGMPATLFDVDRIEVLRGPQGMRYGANALAGLIVMRSADPQSDFGCGDDERIGNLTRDVDEDAGARRSLHLPLEVELARLRRAVRIDDVGEYRQHRQDVGLGGRRFGARVENLDYAGRQYVVRVDHRRQRFGVKLLQCPVCVLVKGADAQYQPGIVRTRRVGRAGHA